MTEGVKYIVPLVSGPADIGTRSAASRKAARVRRQMADARRDGPWGPEGSKRGSAPVQGVSSIREILDRLTSRGGG